MTTTLKATALETWHEKHGARMVDFLGWRLPVQFDGLLSEHRAVRSTAGLFDVSHMGEILVEGDRAADGINRLITNDISRLADGQIIYTVACREDGGILDDLLVYRQSEERFLLVVNAGNTAKMLKWVCAQLPDLSVSDLSADTAQLAIQGPAAEAILCQAAPFTSVAERIGALPFYSFFHTEIGGQDLVISRTGYTGEKGFEIYLPPSLAAEVADSLFEVGTDSGLVPVGLGARDTLRLEASYCLYGNELNEETDPWEAGLSWLVKMDKGEFIGREALERRKPLPEARRLAGFSLPGRKIARHGFSIYSGDEEVGRVSSGSFSPSLERSIGMALIKRGRKKESLAVEVRGERVPLTIEKLPFYSQPQLRA